MHDRYCYLTKAWDKGGKGHCRTARHFDRFDNTWLQGGGLASNAIARGIGGRLIGQVDVSSVVGFGPVSPQYHGAQSGVVPLIVFVDSVIRYDVADTGEILLHALT
jgi:hypothetical protein